VERKSIFLLTDVFFKPTNYRQGRIQGRGEIRPELRKKPSAKQEKYLS